MSYAVNFGVVPEPVYAGFGARLAAGAVDCALVWYAAKAALYGFDAFSTHYGLLDAGNQALFADVARPVALLAYFTAFEGGVGATPGKLMMQLQVKRADLRPQGFARALARNLAKGASVLTLGAGFMLPMFLAKRQALHDLIAGAVVVRG